MSHADPDEGVQTPHAEPYSSRGVSTDMSGTAAWRRTRPVAMLLLPDPESRSGWANHAVWADDHEEDRPPAGFRRR